MKLVLVVDRRRALAHDVGERCQETTNQTKGVPSMTLSIFNLELIGGTYAKDEGTQQPTEPKGDGLGADKPGGKGTKKSDAPK